MRVSKPNPRVQKEEHAAEVTSGEMNGVGSPLAARRRLQYVPMRVRTYTQRASSVSDRSAASRRLAGRLWQSDLKACLRSSHMHIAPRSHARAVSS